MDNEIEKIANINVNKEYWFGYISSSFNPKNTPATITTNI